MIIWIFLSMTISIAQSPYNSISHGIILEDTDASGLAQGISGLMPSFNSRFSISNPSTWSDLRVTYLTSHYTSGEIEYPEHRYKSGFGRLTRSSFVIPIRGKYAFGLGIKPYSRKQFSMEDENNAEVIFSEDTLRVSKQIEGRGGISSFYTGGSWKINGNKTMGIQWDFLFGTFYEITSTNINDNPPTINRRRFRYNGTLLSLFFRVKPARSYLKSTFYLSAQLPVGNQRAEIVNYHSFVDQDWNGIHTGADYPIPEDAQPGKPVKSSFLLPYTMSSSWVYQFSDQTHVGIEIGVRIFSGDQGNHLNTLSGEEKSASRISLGLLRERISGSQQFIDRFHYRIGFFQREHYISRSNNNLSERGITLGLGIPFGVTQNQIDVGFRFSKRDGFLIHESEYLQQITVGVTIGDIWLVKRRRR